jgi:murein L,D-transpeptidase YcbB/YkuD
MFLKLSPSAAPLEKEAALTRAALDYASALARGTIDPKRLFAIYTVPRPNPDLAAGLATAIANRNVAEWLASLPPQSAEYKALSDAYVHYLKVAAQQGNVGIVGGRAIKVGMRDPRVPQLAEALRAYGYLQPAPSQADPRLYTRAMAAAVTRLQGDYGIDADGIVGPDTLEVLNTSAQDKARQLAVNLERRRWLERNPPATRVDVNTAATFLDYWRGGQLRDHRRVIDGQPDWETPELQSPIFQLVANPSWNVPESIQVKEIAPKGPAYLWENNMVWREGRIVQLPGPDNSLGLVKLDMRDRQAIYLHDTPAKALFAENERHLSHGCVRVDNAVGFARLLAGDDGVLADLDDALPSGEETFVKMRTEVPVRLLYHTAFVDEAGQVRFRADPYGWDDRVAGALGMALRGSRRFRSHIRDFGP